MNFRNNLVAKGLFIAAITLGMILGIRGSTVTLANAQDCRSSSYIPGLSPLTLQHVSGATISLQRDSRNYGPTAHVWLNGQYVGERDIPFALAGGAIQVRLRTQHRLETWLGSVRQAYKPVPYVVVCGRWHGHLP
jgi:hypothetical protein